jgi:hypothetical protein
MGGLPDRAIRSSLEDAQDRYRACRWTKSAGGGADAAGSRPRVRVSLSHNRNLIAIRRAAAGPDFHHGLLVPWKRDDSHNSRAGHPASRRCSSRR